MLCLPSKLSNILSAIIPNPTAYDYLVEVSIHEPHETYYQELPRPRKPTFWDECNEPGYCIGESRYDTWKRRSDRFIDGSDIFSHPKNLGLDACPFDAFPSSPPTPQWPGFEVDSIERVCSDEESQHSSASPTPSKSSTLKSTFSSATSLSSGCVSLISQFSESCCAGSFGGKYLHVCHHQLLSILLSSPAGQSRSVDPAAWLSFLREERDRWSVDNFRVLQLHLEKMDYATRLSDICAWILKSEEERVRKELDIFGVCSGGREYLMKVECDKWSCEDGVS